MTTVAWIGLGVMGYPMAGHLAKRSGLKITVYNRTAARAQSWIMDHENAAMALTPAEAARNADFVFACVGNDDDLRSVTIGPDGAFAVMKPGAVFVDHTTASAIVARELAKAAAAVDLAFLDCPVSGGQAGAETGKLTVMFGGDETAYVSAFPLISSYARAVRRIGPTGAGQLTKMVNQIAVAGVIQGLAEAIHFAESSGLDLDAVMETISKGAAQSWQMDNRWKTMHERRFEFGFAVDWMRKDLGIVLAEAARNGATLDVAKLVDAFYAEVQAGGGARWDTSSLISRLG